MKEPIPQERIEQKIFVIRGQKVMLDRDLARLYGVSTGRFNEQVKRKIKRFPEDFMFQLTKEELKILISQFAISRWGGLRKLPYAFTEQGVSMLSSVLNSERAIQVNIAIVRVFTRLKQVLATHKEIAEKLEKLEKRMDKQDKYVIAIFEIIKSLMPPPPEPPAKPKGAIGFK
jgi:phage regulator Rha-like protein